jgi:DNA-binding Lrp family transcriptional regulator
MTPDIVLDAESMKQNCLYYSKLHSKAVDVLRQANGKKDYRDIAKGLGLHETNVSSYLREAYRLGLAQKQGKFYKKVPGILKYMPKSNARAVKTESISGGIAKVSKRKIKLLDSRYGTVFGVSFRDKAQKMAEAYCLLYLTENTLRALIRKVFENEQDWWANRVNDKIKKDVEDAKNRYPYHGAKRRDELEYTHLGQLKEIIAAKNNWDMFLPFLEEGNKNSFQLTVDRAIPSRNSIAHCTSLTEEDFRFVEIRFKDILNMIKSS